MSNIYHFILGQYGSITYKVIVKTDPIWRSKKQCERLFTGELFLLHFSIWAFSVLPCFDLTKDRRFANPISKEQLFMIDKITAIHAINARSYVVECNEDIRYLLYQFAIEQGVGLVTLHLQEQNLEELFRKLTRN